ncbi:MAG: Histidine kinase [Thermodesulfobacteriota bacterium]|nr:Histidine kinase [Thermodesulfobacteriota bacterium]
MKISRLYTKIFLSFLGILVITEALIFALFVHFAGKQFRDHFEQQMQSQATLVKAFVEDKIRAEPLLSPSLNQSLKDLFLRMGEIYGARFWLTGHDGGVLAKSFDAGIPKDVEERFLMGREMNMGPYKVYKRFRKGGGFYVLIPIRMGDGQTGTLHALFQRIDTGPHKGGFALGLAVIGVIIALLVIPVSRQITRPLNRLRQSAVQISEGDLSHRFSLTGKDEISQLGRTFNVMAERLERMIRGGKELTANVSHELRSPLARIRVAEEIIEEQLKRGESKMVEKHLNAIREDIEELDRLIGRILEFSKLDIREKPFERAPLNLPELLRELLDRFETAMKQKGMMVRTELPSITLVYGDRESLCSALSNLLDNAVKFVPNGGEMAICVAEDADHWRLSVTNTYRKLSDNELDKLFEPFYRVEGVSERGTGLGLAIARKIIEQNGGRIHAVNSEKGLEFVILFPR